MRYIPIPIPKEIDALSFDLSSGQRQQLFDSGFKAVSKFLSGYQPLSETRLDSGSYKGALQNAHGGRKKYDYVFRALIRDILEASDAKELRGSIMLPTGRDTRIVVFTFGFLSGRRDALRWHTDADLEIGMTAGCSGQSWISNDVVIADLADRKFAETSGLTPEQISKIPDDRKSMISIPIRSLWANSSNDNDQGEPIGILSVDSSTQIDETRWKGNTRVVAAMQAWANNLTYFMS